VAIWRLVPFHSCRRPLEDWGKLLGDVPSAFAILYRLRNRLADDSGTASETAARPKPASAPTGNRRSKLANETADTTVQTPTT
jgi:hypothetical protein